MPGWTVRHPVGKNLRFWRKDPQDMKPVGWCGRCGGEIWDENGCRWCEEDEV